MAKLIHEIDVIKCIDETGGSTQEAFGGDEIALAGIQIDSRGAASAAKRLNAGNFAKSQVEKVFKPPKVFASFDLSAAQGNGSADRLFQVVLILAELDEGGGLDEHVNNVVDKVNKGEIQFSAGLAGAALARLGEIALAEAKKFAKERLKDDLFPPVISRVEVPVGASTFEDGRRATTREVSFVTAANGKYAIKHNWRIDA